MSDEVKFITTLDLIEAQGKKIRLGAVGMWNTRTQLVVFRVCDVIGSDCVQRFPDAHILRHRDKIRIETGL